MQSNRNVTIGLIQSAVSADVVLNLEKTERAIRQAAAKGARLVCLQELFRTPYFPQFKKRNASRYAEAIPGPTTKALARLASELKIYLIVPLYEKSKAEKFYNSAVVINPRGAIQPTYRKVHLPHDPLFYEKNYFTPSRDGYRVYKSEFGNFAVLICYDQWFPEAARAVALAGAEIIFYPTAIGTIRGYRAAEGDWHAAWETIQRAHAIANSVYVCAVNRVGREGRLKFWGQSFVCTPFGKILARAGQDRDQVIVKKIDLSQSRRIRADWGFFANRRPDTYLTLSR